MTTKRFALSFRKPAVVTVMNMIFVRPISWISNSANFSTVQWIKKEIAIQAIGLYSHDIGQMLCIRGHNIIEMEDIFKIGTLLSATKSIDNGFPDNVYFNYIFHSDIANTLLC